MTSERSDDAGRLQLLYELAYARQPRGDEVQAGADFLGRYTASLQAAGVPAERQMAEAWAALARVVLTSNEFVYLD